MTKYILNQFGFDDLKEFIHSTMGFLYANHGFLVIIATTAALSNLLLELNGMDLAMNLAFVCLFLLEFITGFSVARLKRKERFKSRKFGRMLLKMLVYISMLSIPYRFSKMIDAPDLLNVSLNPYLWIYHVILFSVIFQLLVSVGENLAALGFDEMNNLTGFLLKKLNSFFEFDGNKINNKNDEQNTDEANSDDV